MDFLIAFLGGLLSFISPCVFPLIPAYLALFAGVSLKELRAGEGGGKKNTKAHIRVLINSVIFVLGFSLAFTLLGAGASFVGNILKAFKKEFMFVAGVLLFVFGLHLIGVVKIPFLLEERRADVSRLSGKLPLSLFAFVSGFLFAFGWTPCIGPILAGILTLAASHDSVLEGMSLLFTYSMGLGVPFVLSAVFISYFLSFSARLRKFMRTVEITSGTLLIVISLLFITGRISVFSNISLPNLEELATKLFEKDTIGKFYGGGETAGLQNSKNDVEKEKSAEDGGEAGENQKIYYSIYKEIFNLTPINGLLPAGADFVIVNFWATWCPPCKKEIPDFIEAVEKFDNLLIVGVAYDKNKEKVKEFVEELGINYPIFMFSDVVKNGEYEPDGLPQSLLFYKGKFIGKITGMMELEEIQLFLRRDFSFLD